MSDTPKFDFDERARIEEYLEDAVEHPERVARQLVLLERQLAEAQEVRDEFRAALMNIATAKPHEWTGIDPNLEFRSWAQNRARFALGGITAITATSPQSSTDKP